MNILIAPDKFKGSLTAMEVCIALADGIQQVVPDANCIFHPLADGGDGSLSVLEAELMLNPVEIQVTDPIGRPIQATYYIKENTAFIELAAASGYVLLTESERNPLLTSTFGSGQMMLDAIKKGCQHIFLFLGGSATNDGGMGIAHALGYDFFNENGKLLFPKGENLQKIARIEQRPLDVDLTKVTWTVFCDVENPLYGSNGAAYVYAPQKGASQEMVEQLDAGLQHLAKAIYQFNQTELQKIIGGGAAGGVAAGMVGFFKAQLVSGSQTIMELTNFEEKIKDSDWVITGEGRLDKQTFQGKVVKAVLKKAKRLHKKTAVFVGINQLTLSETRALDVDFMGVIMELAPNVAESMTNGTFYLKQLGKQFAEAALE